MNFHGVGKGVINGKKVPREHQDLKGPSTDSLGPRHPSPFLLLVKEEMS